MTTPRPRASCRLFNMHVSHLAWCLVPAAGAEQRFAESDPKSLPAPAILGSSLTLTPENPAFAGGASFGLSGCPQAREEQSWEQGPSWTVTVTSPGRSLVSAHSVRRAGLLCLSLGRELSALSHAAVHRTMAIVLNSHGYLDILT